MRIYSCLTTRTRTTFAVAVNTVKTVKRNSRVVLDSFVMQNSIEIYNSIKQGNNKTDGIDAAEYREALTEFCTLEKRGYCYYNYGSDGNLNYYITTPHVGFTVDKKLQIFTSYTIYVPIRFAGIRISTVIISITVESKYNEKVLGGTGE